MSNVRVVKVKISSRKGGRGTRKIGRNKVKCARYRSEGRREKNKKRRIITQKHKEQKKTIKLRKQHDSKIKISV